MMKNTKRLLIVANVDWIFIAHRMAIGKEALNKGFQVTVLAKDTGRASEIQEAGMQFIDLPISRSGTHLFSECKALYFMFTMYRKIRPSLVYQVTMKPVIYGTLISKILKLKTVNGISGLGYNFTGDRRSLIQKIMILLMRFAFDKPDNHLVFENKDDLAELQELKIVAAKNTFQIVKGVGVDLHKYYPANTIPKGILTILMPTRLLWDKGVKEFVEAAKLLEYKYKGTVLFQICGMIDYGNKEAVDKSYLLKNCIPGFLEWIGFQSEMLPVYQKAAIVVLPSFREGMPTVLLEAAAVGLPIVTTEAIGCRECVEEGLNGYKVPVKAVILLAKAIEKLINSPQDRNAMGKYSRQKAEDEFDQKEVVATHIALFESIIEKETF